MTLVILVLSLETKKMSNKKYDNIPKIKLPAKSKATSEFRGAHRPHLTGVGDKHLSNGRRSYSLSKSSGDRGLCGKGGTEVARKSPGGMLNDRNDGGAIGGGTLTARDGARPVQR